LIEEEEEERVEEEQRENLIATTIAIIRICSRRDFMVDDTSGAHFLLSVSLKLYHRFDVKLL